MMDRAELRYIAPTFTQNREGPTIGTTVKPVIEVDGKAGKPDVQQCARRHVDQLDLGIGRRVA